MTLRIVFLLLTLTNQASGQNAKETRTILESRFSKYIAETKEGQDKILDEFDNIDQHWKSLEPDTLLYEVIANNILWASTIYGLPYIDVKRLLKKEFSNHEIVKSYTKKQYKVFRRHKELLYKLIISGIEKFDDNYLPIETIELLCFFDIKRGDKIADIGTGMGQLPFLIGLLDYENEIYLTEILPKLIEKLKITFELIDAKYKPKSLKIVEGKKTSTQLPDTFFDKIIVQNTYHHFSKRKKMLKSIKKSLKDNGQLILVEAFSDYNPDFYCKSIESSTKIKAELKAAGFELIDEKKIGDCAVIKYAK